MTFLSRRKLLSTGAVASGMLVAASQTYAGTYDNVGDASQTPGPHDPREEALNPDELKSAALRSRQSRHAQIFVFGSA